MRLVGKVSATDLTLKTLDGLKKFPEFFLRPPLQKYHSFKFLLLLVPLTSFSCLAKPSMDWLAVGKSEISNLFPAIASDADC